MRVPQDGQVRRWAIEVGKGCAWFESRLRFEVRAAPRERRAVDVLEVVRELVVDRRRSGQVNQPAKSET